jgi:anion transporter
MKFEEALDLNVVPDWFSHYIAYGWLKKKIIYEWEKEFYKPANDISGGDVEHSPLLRGRNDFDAEFLRLLDVELEKVTSFYQIKELEVFGDVDEVVNEAAEYEGEAQGHPQLDLGSDGAQGLADVHTRGRSGSGFQIPKILRTADRNRRESNNTNTNRSGTDDLSSDEENGSNERAGLTANQFGKLRRNLTRSEGSGFDGATTTEDLAASREFGRRSSVAAYDDAYAAYNVLFRSGINLKKHAINVYVDLVHLKSFIQENRTGFRKILKKYDKVLDRNVKDRYMEQSVSPSYPFRESTTKLLEANIAKMERIYADVVTSGDLKLARRELRMHIREHVEWERNTVWVDRTTMERQLKAANVGARLQGDDAPVEEFKEIATPVGRVRLPGWVLSGQTYTFLAILAAFLVMLFVPIMEEEEQQNCLAMLVFVSLLWATEVIPLFVTSLTIPFLCVILRVVRSHAKPHVRLGSKAAAAYIFSAMWTPVIMLLLGGFTVAAALSKYNIAKRIATFVLSRAGTRPRTVLLTNMFVAAFASMWISNVAAPVLCFSIIQPMLRNLPGDSDMSKALIMGIALASNVGGMLSPIASPQNIIALSTMSPQPSWAVWFFVAIPVGVISILIIWVLLLVTFRPGKGTTIVPVRPVKDPFTATQWFISFVTLGTIVLWCVSHQLEDVFGDMGVVAIIPIVLFFGTGILTKEDFNGFLWTIIILAAGGLSLGKAVNSSGLLQTVAGKITAGVEGMSLYAVLCVFSFLILVVATFISHTVAALIILPLVYSVGLGMDEADRRPNLLVMGGALMCSAAMGLPTSGFPNMSKFHPFLCVCAVGALANMWQRRS